MSRDHRARDDGVGVHHTLPPWHTRGRAPLRLPMRRPSISRAASKLAGPLSGTRGAGATNRAVVPPPQRA